MELWRTVLNHYDLFQVTDESSPLNETKATFLMNKSGDIDRVSVPLEPNVKEIVFTIKGLEGYSVEFKLDAAGKVTEALLVQPNGALTLKRK